MAGVLDGATGSIQGRWAILATTDTYEVSAEWMKACGKGTRARRYPVVRVYGQSGWTFVQLKDDDSFDGEPWVVLANWRGKFV